MESSVAGEWLWGRLARHSTFKQFGLTSSLGHVSMGQRVVCIGSLIIEVVVVAAAGGVGQGSGLGKLSTAPT